MHLRMKPVGGPEIAGRKDPMRPVFRAGWAAATLFAVACGSNRPTPSPAATGPQTEDEKIAYALGALLGRNVAPFSFSAAEMEFVKKGVADAGQGAKLAVDLEAYGPKIQAFARQRQAAGAQTEKTRSAGFLDKAAKEDGAVKTPSGLVYKTVKVGTGASPNAGDVVSVQYKGTLADGTVFDTSESHGGPAQFPLKGVIPCWTEGVQRMKLGEKARLVCPSDLAYGDQGRPPTIPGGATLVFEVELLAINPPGAVKK
jgi:FKBP-type peptidyl-prolyl cis-trans isomerase FkpA